MNNELKVNVRCFGIVTDQIGKNNNHIELHHPIVINWCVTGVCNNSCLYCYGNNIKNSNFDQDSANIICDNILALKPENVVLTGGEPLINFGIEKVIKKMLDRTNLIIDTNGVILKDDTIKLFQNNDVVLRISLDSSDIAINEMSRPSNTPNSTSTVIKNIIRCLDAGISVIIQTVFTKYNQNDIFNTAKFLLSLGIHEWRIHKVITDNINIIPENEIETLNKLKSTLPLDIQTVNYSDSDPTGIILVEPSGYFYTKTIIGEKVLINSSSPDKPTLMDVMTKINHRSHFNRYLVSSLKIGGN